MQLRRAAGQAARRFAWTILRRTGGGDTGAPLEAALARLALRNPNIQTVIDVGASNGCWSEQARRHFGAATFLLIEANPYHQTQLEQFCGRSPQLLPVLAAAGDRVGEIFFDARNPFGGLASHTRTHPDDIRVPVTTIDQEVKQRGLEPPFFIKLDTHGFEVPILDGATETLRQTELLQVETYNFQLTEDSLRFHEMCGHLEQLGFRPIDLCDPLHRPTDGAFWQLDLFFVPANRPEFASNEYQ